MYVYIIHYIINTYTYMNMNIYIYIYTYIFTSTINSINPTDTPVMFNPGPRRVSEASEASEAAVPEVWRRAKGVFFEVCRWVFV